MPTLGKSGRSIMATAASNRSRERIGVVVEPHDVEARGGLKALVERPDGPLALGFEDRADVGLLGELFARPVG